MPPPAGGCKRTLRGPAGRVLHRARRTFQIDGPGAGRAVHRAVDQRLEDVAMRPLVFPAALLLAVPAALAQCPFTSLTLLPYGQGCNPVFALPPGVTAALDPSTCTVQLTVNAFQGCCNTFLVGYALALGLQGVSIPVPQLGPGCTLLADPVVLLYQTATTGNTFALPLPSLPAPLVFAAQGAAHYFTTIGFGHDFALTGGAQIAVQ
jgi:hypothetical protein